MTEKRITEPAIERLKVLGNFGLHGRAITHLGTAPVRIVYDDIFPKVRLQRDADQINFDLPAHNRVPRSKRAR